MSTISLSDMSLIQALADNELSAEQSASLRDRFVREPDLADAFTELVMLRELMNDMPVVRPARSLRLDRQTMQQARGWRWLLVSPPGGQFMPALGLVACLCMALLFGFGYDQVSAPDQIRLKGAVSAPLSAEAPVDPAAATNATADSVPLAASQPEPSMLPLLGVTIGLVGTAGSARWWLRLRKIQRRSV